MKTWKTHIFQTPHQHPQPSLPPFLALKLWYSVKNQQETNAVVSKVLLCFNPKFFVALIYLLYYIRLAITLQKLRIRCNLPQIPFLRMLLPQYHSKGISAENIHWFGKTVKNTPKVANFILNFRFLMAPLTIEKYVSSMFSIIHLL